MRLRACAAVLLVLGLTGCGSNEAAGWSGPPDPAQDGSVPVDAFAEHQEDVDEPWEGSAEAAAAEFLRLNDRQVVRTTIEGKSDAEGFGPRAVTVTLDGLLDDSVRAERWLLIFEPDGESYKLASAVRTLRCQSGRGHDDFTAEPCT